MEQRGIGSFGARGIFITPDVRPSSREKDFRLALTARDREIARLYEEVDDLKGVVLMRGKMIDLAQEEIGQLRAKPAEFHYLPYPIADTSTGILLHELWHRFTVWVKGLFS